jgi:hypothetical protein
MIVDAHYAPQDDDVLLKGAWQVTVDQVDDGVVYYHRERTDVLGMAAQFYVLPIEKFVRAALGAELSRGGA